MFQQGMISLVIDHFLVQEKQKALNNNILIRLENTKRVKYGDYLCNGFFESESNVAVNSNAIFAIAIGKPLAQWLPIFVHESSHMDQFLEKSPLWISTQEYSQIDDWIGGKDFPAYTIDYLVDKIILLEADCENRSLQKIQKFNLPINIEGYIQKANAYLFFHHYMRKYRIWYDIAPYEILQIINKMPKVLKNTKEYLKKPSSKIIDMFKLCNPHK